MYYLIDGFVDIYVDTDMCLFCQISHETYILTINTGIDPHQYTLYDNEVSTVVNSCTFKAPCFRLYQCGYWDMTSLDSRRRRFVCWETATCSEKMNHGTQ